MTTTLQVTATNLANLNILKLYEHYQILERSMPLLTPESQAICKAELEQTVALRSDKIDRIYYALAAHEDAIERVKKEQDLLTAAKKHHEANLVGLKGLLNWIRRSGVIKENKITGCNYEFILIRKPILTVTISSDLNDWTKEERQKFCIVQEVTTTKQTVLRSIDETVLKETTDSKTKTEVLPNLDELRNAYQTGESIPRGVKIVQEYSIRSKRLLTTKRMDPETSEYNGKFLL
jgi:hypothetical protein